MDDDNTGGGLGEDEYAALQDPRLVMPEVATVLAELHEGITQLGSAFVSAGVPAREWRSDDALLRPLGESLPDVTLDDLLTRAAEFAAGNGPYWLHGSTSEIEQFAAETALLSDAFRPLRVIAQRLLVLPPRERGALPIERALGDGRVGAKLDRVSRSLADLEALAPFMAPLSPDQWNAARRAAPPAQDDQFTEPLPPELIPSPVPAPAAVQRPSTSLPSPPSPPLPSPRARFATLAASPVAALFGRGSASSSAASAARQAPAAAAPRAYAPRVRRLSQTLSGYAAQARERMQRIEPSRWMVVGLVALLLAVGTTVLALASRPDTSAPPAPLAVSPATVTLTCTGKSSSATVTLEWTGTAATSWSAQQVPTGLGLSTGRGTLKPNTGIPITLHVTTRKAAHGTLTFAAGKQQASVAYTVSCG